MSESMSLEAARRCALAASGFHRPLRARDARALKKAFAHTGLSQVDSVARVVRSHYLPFYSRVGDYDRATLDRLLLRSPRMGVEYWAHAAAYAEPATIAMLDGRRGDWYRTNYGQADPSHGAAFVTLMRSILDDLTTGPRTARQLAQRIDHDVPEGSRDHWGWNPTRTKSAAEALFASGAVSVAGRNAHFEKIFALPSDVHPDLPAPVLKFGPPSDPSAGLRPGVRLPRGISGRRNDVLGLTRRAARALGIATVDCLADYFRQLIAPTAGAVQTLVASGELREVTVAGRSAYRWHEAAVPRHVAAQALLAPFDPLVFNRKRISWLFDFDYRISIYTPAAQRVHGYYVMPFLTDEKLVARVDLAADRGASVLWVHGVHWEVERHYPAQLAEELERMRRWLGLAELRHAIN